MDERALRREGRTKLLLATLVMFGIVFAEVVGVVVVLLLKLGLTSLEGTLITEAAGCIAVVGGFMLIGGASWAFTSREDLAYTLCYGWWILLVALAFMGFELVDLAQGSSSIVPGWPYKLALTALLCLVIGIFEEFMFRGIMLGGLLAVMGDTHRGVMRAIILTSLFFGAMHVNLTEDFNDALSVAQAVLKIVQTGVYSVVMCSIVLRSKRLGGASFLHGLDDFLLVMPSVALHGESLSTDYVLEGEQGIEVVVTYVIVIALYLPVAVKCLRDLHHMQLTTRGPLMEVAETRFAAAQAQRVAMAQAPAVPAASAVPMPATTNAWMPEAPTAPIPPLPQLAELPEPLSSVPSTPATAVTSTPTRRGDARGSGRPPIPRGLA